MARSPRYPLGINPTVSAIAVALEEANPHLGPVAAPDVVRACRSRGLRMYDGRLYPGMTLATAMANIYFDIAARRDVLRPSRWAELDARGRRAMQRAADA